MLHFLFMSMIFWFLPRLSLLIAAYIEQALLSGKVSPPSGIFLMKNWLSYKDTVSIEESIPNKEEKHVLTAAELPRLGEFAEGTGKIATQLPQLGDELQE